METTLAIYTKPGGGREGNSLRGAPTEEMLQSQELNRLALVEEIHYAGKRKSDRWAEQWVFRNIR
ncbi:hypothetical protein N7491_010668 [Penicillium cf. griseofulvum]|uniref:Uncharacterized protein n=1 Tax=Penicillium cf. griseofulvum TaxID=2972120 RepID=A0A9W9N0D0_9EURO|nr:hypothetical protein N7472_000995 [Penicillium cf. griseofulvum]KAJ5422223.1 hypothetical protein N7491_010668 [Penicillium cf. griseofulvum]KAJ5428407.1 hypothetical protein N7445_009861 [Penicillium cf. griseofulvum]